MRVWALASCGGLLALGACSADQTNTANPNFPPADGDRLSQSKISPPTAVPSSLARPEMPPRQTLSARPQLNPAAVSTGADRPLAQPQPQSDQLRARLQRLRAQQRERLASRIPIAAAPIPTVVASPTPPTAIRDPGASRDNRLAITPETNRAEQPPLARVPTPLPAAQPPVAKADVGSSGTATDLQPVIAASIANNYPIAPLRHQGHSARHSARSASPQVLPPPSSQPIAASARLHGATAPALATQPTNLAPRSDSRATTALPESLALNSAAPRLSPQRSRLSVSPGAGTDRTTAESAIPAADALNPPPTESFAAPSGGYLSPTDQDGFHLVTLTRQPPKGLSLAYCPPVRAHTPTANRLVVGAIAPQPSFSGRNQSMTPAKDSPLAPCGGQAPTQSVALESIPVADPAPDDLDFPPPSVADLDLENLAPDPVSE